MTSFVEDTKEFLEWWFSHVPKGTFLEIRSKKGEEVPQQHYFSNVEETLTFLRSRKWEEYNVWYGLQPRKKKSGKGEDIVGFYFYGIDYDLTTKTDTGSPQEDYDDVIRWLKYPLSFLLKDSSLDYASIATGNGGQVIVAHKKPLDNSEENRKAHSKKTMERGNEILELAPHEKLICDEVKDAARVLRLPGFVNPKGGRLAQLIEVNKPGKVKEFAFKPLKSKIIEEALKEKLGTVGRYPYFLKLAGLMASYRLTKDDARIALTKFNQENCEEPAPPFYIDNVLSSYDEWLKTNKQFGQKENEDEFDVKWVLPDDTYLFVDQFCEANAAVNRDGHREVQAVRRRGFKTLLIDWLMKANYAPTPHRVDYCADICEALALNNGNKAQLFVRAARTPDGAFWLDLCNDEYSAVKITPGNWEVVADPPILFKRYNHMLPIAIEPGTKQDLDDFVALLNFKDEDDKLLYGVTLAVSIISGVPHPIVITIGYQGSAKTSCCRFTRRIVDNSINLTMALPRNNAELVQQLAHNYFPVFDNVRDMQDWQQDALCRACTGEGFSKRVLFTDDDDFIYRYKRVVGLNGINTPGANPDFIDRALVFTMARIAPANRLREEDLEPKVTELAPRVLGYLCATIANALTILHDVPDKNLPRMADFAYYGEAIARVMGHAPGQFLAAYEANRRKGTQEVVTNSLIGGLVVELVNKDSNWAGTPTEFFNTMQELAAKSGININTKEFPKAPNALSRKLNRLIPNLEELGIKVEVNTTGTVRRVTICKLDGEKL